MAFSTVYHNAEPPQRGAIYRHQRVPYEPSAHQAAIINWVLEGSGNALVEAVAGSGKTTTLEMVARYLPGGGVFCAFNRHVAHEIGTRLPRSCRATTIHGAGFGAIKRRFKNAAVDSRKYRKIVQPMLRRDGRMNAAWPMADVIKIIDLMRLTLCDDSDGTLMGLCSHYNVWLNDEALYPSVFRVVRSALQTGAQEAARSVDFTDMLWLPVVLRLSARTYPWVLVDEAQDLSACQLAMVRKLARAKGRRKGVVRPKGRFLFVGDPHQAIYGFAGADIDSVDRIVREMACTVFPLSTCYRCPTTHVALAQEIVPHIEAAPGADDGTVTSLPAADMEPLLAEGDLIIGRKTAPLLRQTFALIAEGRAAKMRGRDIGENLISTLKKIVSGWPKWISKEQEGLLMEDLPDTIDSWERRRRAAILAKNGGDHEDVALVNLRDRSECLLVIYAHADETTAEGIHSREELEQHIRSIFSDEKPAIWLSTVHRAKGLEAERVFILRPEDMPLPWARGWQLQQEHNLRYVALTRSKRELFLCAGEGA